ncbi:MAG: molybdenum cofactor guanylyltransferase [Bacteroidetes bacterium]|nr:molybdenum cofactor guanylyltransferase [Bacteroidota bacterium]
MIGILLCGGLSSRMGEDKGLRVRNKMTWTEIGLKNFSDIKLRSWVSINGNQIQLYSSRFPKVNFVVDDSNLNIKGPLHGLSSAHIAFPEEDILLLACDLIDMQPYILNKLVAEFDYTDAKAMAFKGEHIEPLCAIYSSAGLKKNLNDYYAGELKQFNMSRVLDRLGATYLPIAEEWKKYFINYNSPDIISL